MTVPCEYLIAMKDRARQKEFDLQITLKVDVADDFGYVCLDKGKRELVNVVDSSKHNAETSHVQHFKQ